ncbi:MAG TPA: hypothetical protein VHP33_12260, partial [Polyangiaceae bacterium]|nr:hypothetical protein [Polyangiaceae bacterium]
MQRQQTFASSRLPVAFPLDRQERPSAALILQRGFGEDLRCENKIEWCSNLRATAGCFVIFGWDASGQQARRD